MSRLQQLAAEPLNIALPADDLRSQKSQTFTHPQEVLDDRELALSDKRALLASWASDALAIENSPSLRQLSSGAIVRVDDIIAALRSLDLSEPRRRELVWTFSQSFARRLRRTAVSRRHLRPDDDDDPPPSAAGARIPAGWTVLSVRRGNPDRVLDVTNGSAASGLRKSREISFGGRSAV
jgi:hypothetical protein